MPDDVMYDIYVTGFVKTLQLHTSIFLTFRLNNFYFK